jgi:hypothetical protein
MPHVDGAGRGREGETVRALLKLAVAAAIVVSAWYAIEGIAEHKSDTLAGGSTFPLDETRAEEMDSFGALLERLGRWEERDLATSLGRLRRQGRLWIAPDLSGDRAAIFVDTLGLVRRIYVRRDSLVPRGLPFPDLDVPEEAQRTYQMVRLAGTLYHELQHFEGLEDEDATYDREVAWYRALKERRLPRLQGEARRQLEWALASALMSAEAAREKATTGQAAS